MAYNNVEIPIPIAIIGMGCRLPGGADCPNKLWDLLSNGHCAWSDVPQDRWKWESFYHPHPDSQEAHNQRGGHFLDQDVAAWDAHFFGVAPSEAKSIDPQQRILLETTFEALENAGMPVEAMRGSDTAVYVATFSQDYETMMMKDTHSLAKYHVTGTHKAIVANRVSYIFDFRGPSLSLDTACSGGLVGLHLACQTLRARESRVALVGGTNLILSPEFMYGMSFLNMLNDDGKSYSFDARGSGYGRGEGVATLVLKRLDDAIADGDPIRAVIKNTGVGQDDKTNGITYPSEIAQERLARNVYLQAGLDPADTVYVEAHGTGTTAGDKIEMGAIHKVFNTCERKSPLFVGSVKANLGHLECTSGLAAVIKSVLILEKGLIPAVPNLLTIKESLKDILQSGIEIPQKLEKWPLNLTRRISIQNFGFGGTNAHMILDAAPPVEAVSGIFTNDDTIQSRKTTRKPQLFVFTAKAKGSLLTILDQMGEWTDARMNDSYFQDLAYTLAAHRSLMSWRAFCVASDRQELTVSLKKTSLARTSPSPPIVFIFTGQGAQWYAMGRELLLADGPSMFQDSIATSEIMLTDLGLDWILSDELMKTESLSRMDHSEVAQVASTAVQIALVDLLTRIGVTANAIVGHSSGEIAAAYAAGVLTRKEALAVSLHRSRVSEWCHEMVPTQGAMMAVGLGQTDISKFLQQLDDEHGQASIACVNSPFSTTISGDKKAVNHLRAMLEKASVFNRLLKVDVAYHSHHTKAVAGKYLQALGKIEGTEIPPTGARFFSSVTGKAKTSGFDSHYWVQNLASQVRFSEALETLSHSLRETTVGSMTPIFIEIGPHAALKSPLSQTLKTLDLPGFKYHYASTLIRGQNAQSSLLFAVGKMFELGYPVDIDAANGFGLQNQAVNVLTSLPTYPWDHSTRHWHESRLSSSYRFRQHPYHDLLGLRTVSGSIDPSWRQVLSVDRQPWLRDHVIDGFMVFPGSGYICMAVEATRQLAHDTSAGDQSQSIKLRDIKFIKALVIPEGPETVEIQIVLHRRSDDWFQFTVASLSASGQWAEHCSGRIALYYKDQVNEIDDPQEEIIAVKERANWIDQARCTCNRDQDHNTVYQNLEKNGNQYGPTFANIVHIRLADNKAVAVVRTPDVQSRMPGQYMQPHLIHPATLDAITHTFLPLQAQFSRSGATMPIFIGEILISPWIDNKAGNELEISVSTDYNTTKIVATDKSQGLNAQPLVVISGLKTISIGTNVHASDYDQLSNAVYHVDWDLSADFFEAHRFGQVAIRSKDQLKRRRLLDRAAAVYIRLASTNISTGELSAVSHLSSGQNNWLTEWMMHFDPPESTELLLGEMEVSTFAEMTELMRGLGVEGELLSRIGTNLHSILVGDLYPISLLFENDGLDKFQTSFDSINQLYKHVGEYLHHHAVNRCKSDVLEIGGSTRGATGVLLGAIKRKSLGSYTVAEKSPRLLDTVRKALGELGNWISLKPLDINCQPLDQGFVSESYDFIIVHDVLHLGSPLETVLANVRQLLVPGGVAVLMGITELFPAHGMIFGPIEGHWPGKDPYQSLSLPSDAEWNQTLTANSFSTLEPATHIFKSGEQKSYCIVSTALADGASRELPVYIIPDGDGKLLETAEELSLSLINSDVKASVIVGSLEPIDPSAMYIVLDESTRPLLANPSSTQFATTRNLLLGAKQVLWVSMRADGKNSASSADMNLATGFVRVARKENQGLRIVSLAVKDDLVDHGEIRRLIRRILKITFQERRGPDYEGEFEYRNGSILVPRVRLADQYGRWAGGRNHQRDTEMTKFLQHERPLILSAETPGLLSSIRFIDDDLREPLQACGVEVLPCAYGVNDTHVGVGSNLSQSLPISEWSGIITAVGSSLQGRWKIGDRVCGLNINQPFASNPRFHNTELMQHLPASTNFASAAASIYPLTLAYHALKHVAKLEQGQAVLIHGADSSIGQAATAIANLIGASVYATIRDMAGKKSLIEEFNVPQSRIFTIESASLRQSVNRQTCGRGVDVILNLLESSTIEESLGCLSSFGIMINLCQINDDSRPKPTGKNATFASLDLGLLIRDRPHIVRSSLEKVISLIEEGQLNTLIPTKQMTITDVEDAIRHISKRQIVGKIVLEVHNEAHVKASIPQISETKLPADATYVVAGGLGDLGQRIAILLASHGARHVVVLSRRGILNNLNEQQSFHQELAALGATLHVLACDITDETSVQDTNRWCRNHLPPVRGVVQSATVFQDRMLEGMDAVVFNNGLRPKREGTINLHCAFAREELDFFVLISSASTVLGVKGQAHYNAGNSFQEGFAMQNNMGTSRTKFIAIMPALISGSKVDTASPELRKLLYRQGADTVPIDRVLSMVEYAIGTQAPLDIYTQLICGIAPEMISTDGTYNTRYFSDILRSNSAQSGTQKSPTSVAVSLREMISAAKTSMELLGIISNAITDKISELISIGADDLNSHVSLANLGIDSLVAIEIKNWIGSTFNVALQTTQILDAGNIMVLAESIKNAVEKSYLSPNNSNEVSTEVDLDSSSESAVTSRDVLPYRTPKEHSTHTYECCGMTDPAPVLPFLDLDTICQLYMESVKHLLQPDDLGKLKKQLSRFTEAQGIGQILHARLRERLNDPAVDNWQFQAYLETCFTARRYPVSPFNTFAASDPLSDVPHGQAERATVISLAALNFKKQLEKGEIKPAIVGGRPQCMYLHTWLFNSVREPVVGIDEMRKFPSSDHIAVLRKGHLFKVALANEEGDPISFQKLQATFQVILNSVHTDSWIGILTADDRDSWAKIRTSARALHPANDMYLDMIETAAFVVCLDGGSPSNPSQRMERMLLNDGFNRWFDKGLKFVICSNGVSGTVTEHTMADGLTIQELFEATASAILSHRPASYRAPTTSDVDDIQLEEYIFESTPSIDHRISHIRERYMEETSIIGFTTWTWDAFGRSFLQARKLSPKGIFETMVQLATRYHMGQNHPCWSPVSMGHYHKARPEIIQTYTPEIQSFCNAVVDDSSGLSAQTLLADAARSHASNILRTQQGRGYERTMEGLQTLLRPGEEVPELYSDPVYVNMRPHWVMTGSLDIGSHALAEFGTVLRYPDSIWVQYIVDPNGARFSIVTGKDRIDNFCECMEKAGGVIHELLKRG